MSKKIGTILFIALILFGITPANAAYFTVHQQDNYTVVLPGVFEKVAADPADTSGVTRYTDSASNTIVSFSYLSLPDITQENRAAKMEEIKEAVYLEPEDIVVDSLDAYKGMATSEYAGTAYPCYTLTVFCTVGVLYIDIISSDSSDHILSLGEELQYCIATSDYVLTIP